jgi:hypothetical protein
MTCRSILVASLLAASGSTIASDAKEDLALHDLETLTNWTAPPPSVASRARQLPVGATPREVFRFYRRGQHHTTLYYMPDNWEKIGWQREGSLGVISSTPFENSRPLYMCQLHNIAWGYLTSGDPGCEGQFLTPFGLIGYISSVPLPNTAPLYRCNYIRKGQLKHFDTHQPNCEQVPLASNDGILGYVFR